MKLRLQRVNSFRKQISVSQSDKAYCFWRLVLCSFLGLFNEAYEILTLKSFGREDASERWSARKPWGGGIAAFQWILFENIMNIRTSEALLQFLCFFLLLFDLATRIAFIIFAGKQNCIMKACVLLSPLHLYVSVFYRHKDSIVSRRMSKDRRCLSNFVLARNSGRVAGTSLRINQSKTIFRHVHLCTLNVRHRISFCVSFL